MSEPPGDADDNEKEDGRGARLMDRGNRMMRIEFFPQVNGNHARTPAEDPDRGHSPV